MTGILLLAPASLVALAAYLLARLGLETVGDVWTVVWRRLHKQRWWLQQYFATGQVEEEKRRFGSAGRLVWGLPLAGGVIMAVLWMHPVLSPWFVLLGGGIAWMLSTFHRRVRREDLRALETFIAALRSVFGVEQSVFGALRSAVEGLDESPLRRAVETAIRRYDSGQDLEEALGALREAELPQLSRLAVVLGRAGYADNEAIRRALLDLEENTRRARQLRDRAQTVLTLTTITLRILQAANIAAVVAVTLIPMWREFYAARPAALVAGSGAAFAASAYFAGEIRRIEDLL
jgi:hypothetical protein